MAKHLVACVRCGRQFDANDGGSYDQQSRRYTCPDCAAQQYDDAVKNLAKKLKRRFIAKIAFGVLSVLSGFNAIGSYDAETVVLCFVIGAALLAWALIPYFKGKKMLSEDGKNGKA